MTWWILVFFFQAEDGIRYLTVTGVQTSALPILPMENQVDYFKLTTGTIFSLPFDVLLIFSTNLQPAELMEPAFLRRIQYKIKLFEPTRAEYRQIFDNVAKSHALALTDQVFDFVVERLRAGQFG